MKLAIVGTFENFTCNSKGFCNMKFKFPYSEIPSFSQLLLTIGKPMRALIVVEDGEDKVKLGSIMYKSLVIDKDGEAKLTIDCEVDEIDLSQLSCLKQKVVTLKLKTVGGESDA